MQVPKRPLRIPMKTVLRALFVLGSVLTHPGCDKLGQIIHQAGSVRGTDTEKNRVWIRDDPHRNNLVIFIHGFNSNSHDAWGNFPDLMKDDAHFEDFNIVLYGYMTTLWYPVDSIRNEGNALASFLTDTFKGRTPSYRRIILVGHSMGGLVIIHALLNLELNHSDVLFEHDLRVVTFGTPFIGVQNTDLLPPFLTNKQTDSMAALHNEHHELRQGWNQRFNQELAIDRSPTPQVPLYSFYGAKDDFVTMTSACALAKIPCEAVDGDHVSMVKPSTPKNLAYSKVRQISSGPSSKEPHFPDVSLLPQAGYTSASFQAGQEITEESMRDRKQYLLTLTNKTSFTFDAIELRLQLPYPIDEKEILPAKLTGNVKFDPAGPVLSVEGGSAKFRRKPITSTYELRLENMRPGGQVEILFILNSWRDPRGKIIPPGERARHMIPEWGPHITYMDGYFLVRGKRESYYAPFDLSEAGTVILEKSRERPKELHRKLDFQ